MYIWLIQILIPAAAKEKSMTTIAIIDDDIHIGDMLKEVLEKEQYRVIRAYSGTEALYMLSENTPDLILLDLMLPGLSGEEVLPKIKGIPVIVISAKVDVSSKVNLLLGGACDYMTKPFDIDELLARITVQLRKKGNEQENNCISHGDLYLNPNTREVLIDDKPVRLTKTEYAILKILMINYNQVLSKSVILDLIATESQDCTEDSLKQHVSNLRVKLREASGRDMIEAVWGIGYKLQ